MTALAMAAKTGQLAILDVYERAMWKKCSKKTGLNPMHVAAYYGQQDFVREMLVEVPATCRTEPAAVSNYLVPKELASEYGFTPLHMASQAGHDGLVRMLLNIQSVQVDANTTTMVGDRPT